MQTLEKNGIQYTILRLSGRYGSDNLEHENEANCFWQIHKFSFLDLCVCV